MINAVLTHWVFLAISAVWNMCWSSVCSSCADHVLTMDLLAMFCAYKLQRHMQVPGTYQPSNFLRTSIFTKCSDNHVWEGRKYLSELAYVILGCTEHIINILMICANISKTSGWGTYVTCLEVRGRYVSIFCRKWKWLAFKI